MLAVQIIVTLINSVMTFFIVNFALFVTPWYWLGLIATGLIIAMQILGGKAYYR